jgi:ABC-2 type transport system ATP-binding protein
MSQALLSAQGLSRWYGPVVGLNDLTLEIEGGVVGLLGPNGAGKSTFLKLVAGEIRPSRGSVRVLGFEPFANREYFQVLGFCPQQDALYEDLDAREFVSFLLRLSGFDAREARARAERALERTGMQDAMLRRTAGFSKGMRQRTKLAAAIAHDPRFLIVDEPLTGLDPLVRADMIALFQELGRSGVHVLISSHVLHEIESVTENILLLHRGRLLAQGPVPEIRRLLSRYPHKVEIRARDPRRLARALLELEGTSSVHVAPEGGRLALETFDLPAFHAELPRIAARERAGIQTLESTDAGLDAVFDYLVG